MTPDSSQQCEVVSHWEGVCLNVSAYVCGCVSRCVSGSDLTLHTGSGWNLISDCMRVTDSRIMPVPPGGPGGPPAR